MTVLKETIEIEATPSKVFEWFIHLAENYKGWHPDHVKADWIEGNPMEIGSVLCTEEYLHGSLHEIKGKLIRVEKNRLIMFKHKLPTSLICHGGAFEFEEKGGNCVFTASLFFRMGKVLSRIAGNRTEAIAQHMKEEGENLKRLLEK